ncbi:MAG: HEAT repeat domain-containing protein [Planctomycetes bacterium]|nr:HEAT repeat domain-containing protein [Planctomycetota bacterium]
MGSSPGRISDTGSRAASRPRTPRRLRSLQWAPVLLASGITHLILLLILSQFGFFPVTRRPSPTENITVDLREIRPHDPLGELLSAIEKQQEAIIEQEAEESGTPPQEPVEAEIDAPDPGEAAVEVELPDLAPRKPTLALGNKGHASTVENRTPGGRQTSVQKYGGTEESESAVKLALQWLMRHQAADGSWSCIGFGRNCRGGPGCGGRGSNNGIDTGLTGLALLAFLSGGHHQADATDFGRTIARGVRRLLRTQDDSGRIGPASSYEMYNHCIATLAIAEARILAEDQALHQPLERAVGYITAAQQPGGGWDYTAARTGRNDTSITGFAVMALKSASAAGIEVPWTTTYGMLAHFHRMTRDNAEVIYSDQGIGAGRAGPGMIAVGALARQFLGWPIDAEVLRKQYFLMRRNLPRWELLPLDAYHNMYYWYYGTLAMFQAGGDNWRQWNDSLRDMLVRRQRQKGCARGSWDPAGKWLGKAAGRVYSTAMNAMNLQVYYRYLPVYDAPTLNSVEALVRAGSTRGEMRIRALQILAEFRSEQSREMLEKALTDEDPFVRLNAAVTLIAHGRNETALPVLIRLSRRPNGFLRTRAVEEMVKLDSLELIPALIERLADEQTFIATRAAEKLRKLCRVDLAFEASANTEAKDRSIAAWREWYRKYKAGEVTIDASQVFGTVTHVKPEEKIVMINVGRADAVADGDDFDVIRRGRIVGRLRVFRTLKQSSAARIVHADTHGAIRKQDVVRRTKIEGPVPIR